MKYITYQELTNTIRKNIWKIPRDIDCIIGVPRSGMLVANIISSYLNIPLIDVSAYSQGLNPCGGQRMTYFNNKHKHTGKALVVDDTVYGGSSMTGVKNILQNCSRKMEYIYMCVYLEGYASDVVDFYLEDIHNQIDNDINIALYEWNIFQHHIGFMQKCLYDIDGVFCVEPPDERNEKAYIEYISDATPLFIPKTKIGGIVTYRLSKNKDITEKWLDKVGITYSELYMFKANSWEERHNSGISPEIFKAEIYKERHNMKLFVESSDYQAKRIYDLTKKPVLSVDTNTLYQ